MCSLSPPKTPEVVVVGAHRMTRLARFPKHINLRALRNLFLSSNLVRTPPSTPCLFAQSLTRWLLNRCTGFTYINEDSSEITFLLVENYQLTASVGLRIGWESLENTKHTYTFSSVRSGARKRLGAGEENQWRDGEAS